MLAIQKLQFWIIAHIQAGQLVFPTHQIYQCRIVPHIQTGQIVLAANQIQQCRILAHIQAVQIVFVAIQFLQFFILAHIQAGQIVFVAIQIPQVGEELNALQARELFPVVSICNFDRIDRIPLRFTEFAIAILVYFNACEIKVFIEKIVSECFIREVGCIDFHILRPFRKGTEGQEGKYHGCGQQAADKAHSFGKSLSHRSLLSVCNVFPAGFAGRNPFLTLREAQPPCPAGGRMVIRPSTAASSISCSRKYSIRIS